MAADDEIHPTVVLGFDALDFEYLDRFSESLPNFDRLREAGVESPLESTHPPWTASAWPSMYTGTDPSHHGTFGFFRYDGYPDTGRIVSRNDVEAPALWNYLTSVGVPSVVCNVPVTHPAEPIDGALVPGYLAREDAPGYPDDVRQRLSETIGERYRIYSSGEMASDSGEKLAGYLDLIDLRRRAAVALLEDFDWSLAVLQIQKTDAVFHNFEDRSAHLAVYEAADAFLGSVLECVDDAANVVVCSDHGIGPVRGHQIHCNEVLREHGYVEASPEEDRVSLSAEKRALVDGDDLEGDGGAGRLDLLSPLVGGLSRVGVTPDRVYSAAERLGLEDTLVSLTPASVGSAVAETVDWRASKAYCRRASRLGVRINLEGREPDGIVPAGEYQAVKRDLVDLLSELSTPDGEPAFETVGPREEFFDGPMVERAPDVVVVPRGMNHSLSTALYGRTFVPVDGHDHKRHGVFSGAGPGFATGGAGVRELALTDVAPIVMALLGQPVPSRMTGRVPDGLLSLPVERESYGDVPYGTRPTTTSHEGEITDRLADLGYL